MALIKTGDWNKLNHMLKPGVIEKRLKDFGTIAANRAGALLVRRIRQQMRKASSPPNHPITISRKGSSKPLFDDGNLFGAVTSVTLAPYTVFAGILNTSRDPDSGVSLALIARVMEGGEVGGVARDTIIVPRNASALFIPLKRRIRPNDPGLKRGEDFVLMKRVRIRPRRFITPSIKRARKEVLAIYESATRAAFLTLIR